MTVTAPIPITNLAALRDAGIVYPGTVDAWRWIWRCRRERGLDGAFVRVGRRICVLPDRYIAAIRSQTDTSRASG